jgi:signal recognition particle subunit SRP54
MLEQLTTKLARVVKTMRGQARLTEENMQEMLREVRVALLEADVALPVVREFLARIKEKALGEEVVGSLSPGQALVGVVQRELTQLMGGDLAERERDINLATQPPAVILLAGLQGAGKTTTAGKLARWLKEERKKKVLAVSTDVYRPAAIDQLKTVAGQAGAEFFPSSTGDLPVDIAARALDHAKRHFFDVLIVDTAGRLAIDEEMMQEVTALEARLQPIETLFVVDAMLGQDAVNTARAFSERLPLTGVILTKLDGDSRGGAALSVRHVTGKPIKFVGVGEKLSGFERFQPEGMASRVLGMGDIVALVEDVKKSVDVESAQKLAKRMQSGEKFDLNDFREQIGQMRKMGGLSSMLDKLPAQFAQAASQVNSADSEKQIRRIEGIISSMTPAERAKPELIKASRKRRIATGAGVPVQDVNRMLSQFEQMQSMMKQMRKGGLAKMMRGLGRMPGMPGLPKR